METKTARELALENTPKEKVDIDGVVRPLTAIEKISEAEIIYQWLIKDLQ